MSISYDLFENPPREGDEGTPWLHARPVIIGTLKTDDLAKIVSARSSFSSADLKGLLDGLSERLFFGLSNSHNVYLEGIGTFSVTLKSKPVRSKKDIRSVSVSFKNITFKADPKLKRQLEFTNISRVKGRSKKVKHTDTARKKRILWYIDQYQSINVTTVMGMNQCNHKKARQDLNELLDAGEIRYLSSGTRKIYIR